MLVAFGEEIFNVNIDAPNASSRTHQHDGKQTDSCIEVALHSYHVSSLSHHLFLPQSPRKYSVIRITILMSPADGNFGAPWQSFPPGVAISNPYVADPLPSLN
jgi:hypothetical protein